MSTRKHIIELENTSASEMARFRRIMLGIWRQQIEDDKNAGEMEKFVKMNNSVKTKPQKKVSKKSYKNDLFYVDEDGNITKVEINKSRYITVVLSGRKKVLLSDLDISGSTFSWNNTNRQIVANIAGYYGKQVNVKNIGANYDRNDKSLAYTDSKNKIWFHPTSKGGIDPDFNDKYNLQSTIIHEHNHQKELQVKTYTYSAHAKVYLKQFQHPTFKMTSKGYYEGQMGSFIKYLDYASGHEEKGWENILKKFNDLKILGGYQIKYRESGGTQLFNNKGIEVIFEPGMALDGPH
jgi:hypothetical protein